MLKRFDFTSGDLSSHITRLTIYDDDFDTIVPLTFTESGGEEVERAIIQLYEERKLNVAANLLRCIVILSGYWKSSVSEIIAWNKKNNPLYGKYADDVEKYLLLI